MILTEVEKREKSLNFKSKKIKILEVDHTAPSKKFNLIIPPAVILVRNLKFYLKNYHTPKCQIIYFNAIKNNC